MPTIFAELLRAIFELGLPVAALSWLLFYRLYSRGLIARDADRKAIGASLKSMRKAEKESKEKSDSLLQSKWMKFGLGFYGIAAAWTLIYNELSGIVAVVLHPSVVMAMFSKGIGNFIALKIASQVTTLVDAATWFSWWAGRGKNPIVWFVVAYVAYVAGFRLARYETGFGSRAIELDSRSWWRARVPLPKWRAGAVKEEGGNPAQGGE